MVSSVQFARSNIYFREDHWEFYPWGIRNRGMELSTEQLARGVHRFIRTGEILLLVTAAVAGMQRNVWWAVIAIVLWLCLYALVMWWLVHRCPRVTSPIDQELVSQLRRKTHSIPYLVASLLFCAFLVFSGLVFIGDQETTSGVLTYAALIALGAAIGLFSAWKLMHYNDPH